MRGIIVEPILPPFIGYFSTARRTDDPFKVCAAIKEFDMVADLDFNFLGIRGDLGASVQSVCSAHAKKRAKKRGQQRNGDKRNGDRSSSWQ